MFVGNVSTDIVMTAGEKVVCVSADPELNCISVDKPEGLMIFDVLSQFGAPIVESLNMRDPEVYNVVAHVKQLASRVSDRVAELVKILERLPDGRICAPGDGNAAMLFASILTGRSCESSDPNPLYPRVIQADWKKAVKRGRKNDIYFFSYCAEFFAGFGSWLNGAQKSGKKVVVLGVAGFPIDKALECGLQSWYSDGRLLTLNIQFNAEIPYYNNVVDVDRRFFRNAGQYSSLYVSTFKLVPWVKLMARLGTVRSCLFDFASGELAEHMTGLSNKFAPQVQIVSKFSQICESEVAPKRCFDLRSGQEFALGDTIECSMIKLRGRVVLHTGKLYCVDGRVERIDSYDVGHEFYMGKCYIWLEFKKFYPSTIVLRGVVDGGMYVHLNVVRAF